MVIFESDELPPEASKAFSPPLDDEYFTPLFLTDEVIVLAPENDGEELPPPIPPPGGAPKPSAADESARVPNANKITRIIDIDELMIFFISKPFFLFSLSSV